MQRAVFSPAPVLAGRDSEPVRRVRRLLQRRQPGEILLEGPRVIAEAVACGLELDLLVVREGESFDVAARRGITVSGAVFKSLSQTVSPQGALAIAHRELDGFEAALAAARSGGWPLLVLDGIQDPGNVGAICRSAAAAGAPALAFLPGSADPFGPKAVRASAGNVFRLLVARAAWADLPPGAWGAAASGGTPVADSPIDRAEVLVMGSEAHGLSGESLNLVTIPIAGGVESLNVAAAAAVLLFEIRRRKSG